MFNVETGERGTWKDLFRPSVHFRKDWRSIYTFYSSSEEMLETEIDRGFYKLLVFTVTFSTFTQSGFGC